MVKHFNIIMAGVISGVVALFTSVLGISGTIIGSVLTSFLYQLLSTYYEEKTKDMDLSQVGNNKLRNRSSFRNSTKRHKIIFIFPIVVILLIECLFALTSIHSGFLSLFNLLESLTDQNLFRVMGLGLIVISFYPFFRPKIVSKSNGVCLFIIGVLLLLRGLVDSVGILNKIYYLGFFKFDLIFALIVIVVLLIVVIRVLKSIADDPDDDYDNIEGYNVREVDTHFNEFNNQNQDNFYHNEYYSNNPNEYYSNEYYPNDYYPNDYYPNDYYPDDYYQNDNYYSDNQYPNNKYSNYNQQHNQYHNYDNSYHNQNSNYLNNYDDAPIYEEEFIYVQDPNNPNRTIKKRILKKVDMSYNDHRRR